jgi:hypothetical protein
MRYQTFARCHPGARVRRQSVFFSTGEAKTAGKFLTGNHVSSGLQQRIVDLIRTWADAVTETISIARVQAIKKER